MRDVLQHHRLAGLRRRDEQAALALADRRDDVDDAAGDVLLGLDVALEHHRLVGEERRQVLEEDLVLRVLGRLAVDLVDLDQREVALAVLRRADLAFDRVAGVQVEAADLRRRDVDVVGAGEVGGVGRAQEAEAVGQHLEHAVAEDAFALLRLRLEQREDEVVLAHAVRAFDLDRVRDVEQLGDVLGFEFGQVHGACGNGRDGRSRPGGRIGIRGGAAMGGRHLEYAPALNLRSVDRCGSTRRSVRRGAYRACPCLSRKRIRDCCQGRR